MLDQKELAALLEAAKQLDCGFARLPKLDGEIPGIERFGEVLNATAERLKDNYPYFHPLYAGQMLKPPHPVARMAYALAMCINPNNHALDGGRATSAMEKEAVAEIAGMFGWKNFLGHLCGGGTMANLEALWVAGQLHPERNGWNAAMLGRWLQRWGPRQRVPWTRSPRFLRCNRNLVSEFTPTRLMVGISFWQKILPKGRNRHWRGLEKRIPSSSIRTNMDCSLTDVDACCFAIRAWADFTSMIRRTPISVRRTCISVRLAWNVQDQVRRRQLFGRRKSYCHL